MADPGDSDSDSDININKSNSSNVSSLTHLCGLFVLKYLHYCSCYFRLLLLAMKKVHSAALMVNLIGVRFVLLD